MSALRPTAPIAADALLPGDPARAMRIAQELLVQPKMSNHAHGLWGYGGETEDGQALTIQSIGIGGASGALVLSELAQLGVKRAIQVGTCRAVDPSLELGQLLVVGEAIGADGVSRALADGDRERADDEVLVPDPALGAALAAAAEADGVSAARVASTDLLGALDGRPDEKWLGRGAVALEMAAAPLLAAGRRGGVAVAGLLCVSESGTAALDEEALDRGASRLGRLALAALSSSA